MPGIDGRPHLLYHFGGGNHGLAAEMAAALGHHLVLDLDRVGATALQHPDRAPDIDRIAEACVGVHHQRQIHGVAHGGDMVRELRQRQKPEIRLAEKGVGYAGAGYIDRVEAEIGDDARGERIRRSRDDHALAPRQTLLQTFTHCPSTGVPLSHRFARPGCACT